MTLAISQQTAYDASGSTNKNDKVRGQNAALADEFSKWMQMSPAEKIRAQYLADHNLTEKDLEAMDPKDRQKIEDDIAKRINQQLGLDSENKARQAQNGAASSLQSQLAGLALT